MPQKYAGNLDAEMISGTVENDLYQKHEMVQKIWTDTATQREGTSANQYRSICQFYPNRAVVAAFFPATHIAIYAAGF